MKELINSLLDRKLLVTLVVVIAILAGLVSLKGLNRESIPDVNFDMVQITTIYPGASPADAEDLVSVPIEKKLRSVNNLDKVRSYNVENLSLIVVFIEDRAKDKKKVVQDIKDAVEQVENLPANAKKPVVAEVSFDTTEIMQVVFTGKDESVPYGRIREFANVAEDYFYDIGGIGKIDKFGFYDREYRVMVNPKALDRNRVGINEVVRALKMRNINYPGGPLRIGKKEFVLRTKGNFKNAEEIRNTVIRGNDTGYILRIGDVAKVYDSYKEADEYHRFNGKKAVIFKLWKKRSADEIELSKKLQRAIKELSIPGYDDIEVTYFNDFSEETKRRIQAVIHEAIVGFIILGIFILMLLGHHMTGIVLAGIPVTFMVTFAFMKLQGMTINIISLFGMIMVLGMMVDFSIVIAENCHRYIEKGFARRDAVSTGVSEVFWSVTVTLLCIIAAFMPLLIVSGMVGKFVRAIPIVIITTLLSAWVIAMFILPTYLNIFLPKGHGAQVENTLVQKFLKRIFGKKLSSAIDNVEDSDENIEVGLFGHVQRRYKRLITFCLKYRYATVGVLFILLITALSLVPLIGFKFMSEGGEEQIRVRVKMPFESNLDSNLTEMKKLEKLLLNAIPKEEFEALHLYVGKDFTMAIDPKPPFATFKSTFDIFLVPETERKRIVREIVRDLRSRIAKAQESGELFKDMEVRISAVFKGPPVGKPVNVEIQGKDFAVIKKIAAEYMDFLKTINGVSDISIDLENGKTEYHYSVNEKMAAKTGLSTYDVAVAINASFYGAVATTVNQNEEEVGVRVRFQDGFRKKRKGLSEVKVSNNRGGLMPLDAVSNVKIAREYSQINRLNYKRLVQVQAEVDTAVITPVEVTKKLRKKFADIGKRYPGYVMRYGGEQEDTNKSMAELGSLFLAALLFIFVVITVFTNSLIMPVIIMVAIPFSIIGIVFALATHGQPLSFMSTLGGISLAGIIVSNTLVLVQFINNFRESGLGLKEALIEGGVVRLRPIILTAGAMVLELLPVIYGVGGKDYLVAPLALAFGYGLLFATFITLILVPCFYHIAEDMKGAVSRLLEKLGIHMESTIYRGKAS